MQAAYLIPAPPRPVKPFRPSARQVAYVNAWCDPAAAKSTVGIAKLIGVDRGTVYAWLDKPDFMAWFNAEMDKRTEHLWRPILNKTTQLALQGSAEHTKLLAQIRGDLRTGDGGGSASAGVVVNVGIPRPGDPAPIPIESQRPAIAAARSDEQH